MAEKLGAGIAADEKQHVHPLASEPLPQVLYLGLDAYYPWYPLVLPVFGFFVFGVFSGHAVYFPELFPTQIRSTGVAFCNGAARIITSSDQPKRNPARRPQASLT